MKARMHICDNLSFYSANILFKTCFNIFSIYSLSESIIYTLKYCMLSFLICFFVFLLQDRQTDAMQYNIRRETFIFKSYIFKAIVGKSTSNRHSTNIYLSHIRYFSGDLKLNFFVIMLRSVAFIL